MQGTHSVQFIGYLGDIDQIAQHSFDLNFNLQIQLSIPLNETEQEELSELPSQFIARQAPISLNPIAPIYEAYLGETT